MRLPLARSVAIGVAVSAGLHLAPTSAKTDVAPYLEVEQVVDADFNGGGDVFTYTSIAAGIDASASTQRTQAQASVRYERHIDWGHHDGGDNSVATGLARVDYHLTPDVTLEAGGIAARARGDNRGTSPLFFSGNDANTSKIYGIYAGPSFARTFGQLDVAASYRFGYVNVDSGAGTLDLGAGQPVLDDYSSSISHNLDASVGMGVGPLPFAWTVSGGYQRESVDRLDQRNTDEYVRGDITLPVTYTLALIAGAGYEHLRSSQADILRNTDGSAVLSPRRRFVADHGAPRLLAYDIDGLIYDGGIIWKPNHRTTLEIQAGRRYGESFVTGTLDYRMSETLGLQAGVYNEVDSFGRQLTNRLATMPTAFQNPINPLVDNLDSCVFGTTPGSGACLGGLDSVTTSNYRSRGAYALLSGGHGRWRYGLGGGYDQRRYLAPSSAGFFSLAGVEDDSFTAQATLTRDLSRNSSLEGALYALWYDSGIADTPGVTDLGTTITYNKSFSNHLSGQAALGAYITEQKGTGNDTIGSALLGLRYQF